MPDAEWIVDGSRPYRLDTSFELIPVPGHTRAVVRCSTTTGFCLPAIISGGIPNSVARCASAAGLAIACHGAFHRKLARYGSNGCWPDMAIASSSSRRRCKTQLRLLVDHVSRPLHPDPIPDAPIDIQWIDRNILALGREMRLSYLPPLMVYAAYGISGLTGIVGTFFVKEYLGLSAAFLAALGFWAGIPWALKMPLGHLVDLMWRWKAGLVYLGAALIAASLLIMVGLIGHREAMTAIMPAEAWFVLRRFSRRSATSCKTPLPTR